MKAKLKTQVWAGVTAVLLAACAKPVYVKPPCPAVPECRMPSAPLETNEDLARAFVETRHELAMCKIARDTLAGCVSN